MGAAHNAFVPAAILLENPGITLDELDDKIKKVGPFRNYVSQMIGHHAVRNYAINITNRYNTGPICIAQEVLRIPINLSHLNPHPRDSWRVYPLELIPKLGNNEWLSPEYRVNHYAGEKFEEEHIHRTHVFKKFRKGGRLSKIASENGNYYLNGQKVQVSKSLVGNDYREVFRIEEVLETGTDRVDDRDMIYQVLRLKKIVQEYEQERFQTFEELKRKHPEFSLDRLFDFSQTSGDLEIGIPFNMHLRWFKKGGGYYLDTDALLKRQRQERDRLDSDEIYTWIILTAEAIRHKEWEMLEYCSGDERPGIVAKFLAAHPDSTARHGSSLIQFYDCKEAVMQNQTNSDWLRARALTPGRRGLTPEQQKRNYELFREEAPEHIARMERKREYLRRCLTEKVKRDDEPPF